MIEHGAYFISDDRALLNMDVIHRALTSSYWSPGIPYETVARALEHSYCVGVYQKTSKSQVGFARLITDFATFAYLADVFILDGHKGQGLSKAMMRFLVLGEQLQGLRRWMLATRDAHGLYAQYGFTPVSDPDILMQRHDPDVYQRMAGQP